jgi:hypothetical protein
MLIQILNLYNEEDMERELRKICAPDVRLMGCWLHQVKFEGKKYIEMNGIPKLCQYLNRVVTMTPDVIMEIKEKSLYRRPDGTSFIILKMVWSGSKFLDVIFHNASQLARKTFSRNGFFSRMFRLDNRKEKDMKEEDNFNNNNNINNNINNNNNNNNNQQSSSSSTTTITLPQVKDELPPRAKSSSHRTSLTITPSVSQINSRNGGREGPYSTSSNNLDSQQEQQQQQPISTTTENRSILSGMKRIRAIECEESIVKGCETFDIQNECNVHNLVFGMNSNSSVSNFSSSSSMNEFSSSSQQSLSSSSSSAQTINSHFWHFPTSTTNHIFGNLSEVKEDDDAEEDADQHFNEFMATTNAEEETEKLQKQQQQQVSQTSFLSIKRTKNNNKKKTISFARNQQKTNNSQQSSNNNNNNNNNNSKYQINNNHHHHPSLSIPTNTTPTTSTNINSTATQSTSRTSMVLRKFFPTLKRQRISPCDTEVITENSRIEMRRSLKPCRFVIALTVVLHLNEELKIFKIETFKRVESRIFL